MINSVEKTMTILTAISDVYGDSITLDELYRKTNINKSTCVHVLNTLRESGFVERISRMKGYRLGPATFYLTRYGRFQEDLIQICHPMLKWLNLKVGQTSLLAVIHENKKFIIHFVEGSRKLSERKTNLILGNIYSTATGRVMLANMDKRDILDFYKTNILPTQEQWPNIDSSKKLFKELDIIKNQGIAIVTKEVGNLFDISYASDINNGHKSIGAVGLSKFYNTVVDPDDKEHKLVINHLKACTKEINRRLTYAIEKND